MEWNGQRQLSADGYEKNGFYSSIIFYEDKFIYLRSITHTPSFVLGDISSQYSTAPTHSPLLFSRIIIQASQTNGSL